MELEYHHPMSEFENVIVVGNSYRIGVHWQIWSIKDTQSLDQELFVDKRRIQVVAIKESTK
jgi:hypothetical protein